MHKRGLIAALLAAATVVTGTACNKTNNSQPAPHTVDTQVMDYCRGDNNKAPEKQQQLTFLRERDVTVTSGVIDYKIFTTDGYTAYVRYYAGDDQPTWRCLFGLEEPSGQLAGVIEYNREGKAFVPPNNMVCLSAKPPTITTTGLTQVKLRCDQLLPR